MLLLMCSCAVYGTIMLVLCGIHSFSLDFCFGVAYGAFCEFCVLTCYFICCEMWGLFGLALFCYFVVYCFGDVG